MEWVAAGISALASIVVALFSYIGNRQGAKEASASTAKLVAYRLEELEKKVSKHNNLIERMYKLEGQMQEVEHDIQDMKKERSA